MHLVCYTLSHSCISVCMYMYVSRIQGGTTTATTPLSRAALLPLPLLEADEGVPKTDAPMADAADASAPADAKPEDAKDAQSDVKQPEGAPAEAAKDEPAAEMAVEAAKDDKVFCLSLAGVCACTSLVCLSLRVACGAEVDVFFFDVISSSLSRPPPTPRPSLPRTSLPRPQSLPTPPRLRRE